MEREKGRRGSGRKGGMGGVGLPDVAETKTLSLGADFL